MTKRLRLTTIVVTGIVVAAAVGFIPVWQRLSAARDELTFTELSAAQHQGQPEQRESLDRLQAQRDALRRLFITTANGVVFLEQLDGAADQAGVKLQVTFAQEPRPNRRQRVPITLTISGPYPDALAFALTLPTIGPFLHVVELAARSTGPDHLTLTVGAETLWE